MPYNEENSLEDYWELVLDSEEKDLEHLEVAAQLKGDVYHTGILDGKKLL